MTAAVWRNTIIYPQIVLLSCLAISGAHTPAAAPTSPILSSCAPSSSSGNGDSCFHRRNALRCAPVARRKLDFADGRRHRHAFTLRTAGALSDFIPHVAEVPISITATADRTVLFVTFIVSIITSVIFGVLPALRSSSLQPANVLKEEVGSVSGGLHKARLSSILVVAQIAMSLLLLVCAGLFIRSVRSKEQFNTGFNPRSRFARLLRSFRVGL